MMIHSRWPTGAPPETAEKHGVFVRIADDDRHSPPFGCQGPQTGAARERILADRTCRSLARIRERLRGAAAERLAARPVFTSRRRANLARTLKAAGADLVLVASNPLSTQDDVAASPSRTSASPSMPFAKRTTTPITSNMVAALEHEPHVTMDDGADLVSAMVFTPSTDSMTFTSRSAAGPRICRRPNANAHQPGHRQHGETTTGVNRLRAMEKDGVLKFPVIAVNDAQTKHFFDNRYGTGQSTIDGIIRATNTLLAGRKIVVCGYGWCGKGVALRARGLGSLVIVTEVDPIRALEAAMDGFAVMPIGKAAEVGDIFITVTGNAGIIRQEHFAKMRDGSFVCNSGHFDVELDLPALKKESKQVTSDVRANVDEYHLKNGRRYVLAKGDSSPGRRQRASAERHGHVVRDPGTDHGILRPKEGQARCSGPSGSRGNRTIRRRPQARVDGN